MGEEMRRIWLSPDRSRSLLSPGRSRHPDGNLGSTYAAGPRTRTETPAGSAQTGTYDRGSRLRRPTHSCCRTRFLCSVLVVRDQSPAGICPVRAFLQLAIVFRGA